MREQKYFFQVRFSETQDMAISQVLTLNSRQEMILSRYMGQEFRAGNVTGWRLDEDNYVQYFKQGSFLTLLNQLRSFIPSSGELPNFDQFRVTDREGEQPIEEQLPSDRDEEMFKKTFVPRIEFQCKWCGKYGESRHKVAFCSSFCHNAQRRNDGKWYQTKFDIDGIGEFVGWTLGERWNGWSTPYFEKEAGIEVAKEFKGYYDEEGGFFVFPDGYDLDIDQFSEENKAKVRLLVKENDSEGLEALASELDIEYFNIYEAEPIEVDGKTITTYPIGAGSWIWTEEEKE